MTCRFSTGLGAVLGAVILAAGCDWHPSGATHAKMAALLVAELKTRLGW